MGECMGEKVEGSRLARARPLCTLVHVSRSRAARSVSESGASRRPCEACVSPAIWTEERNE